MDENKQALLQAIVGPHRNVCRHCQFLGENKRIGCILGYTFVLSVRIRKKSIGTLWDTKFCILKNAEIFGKKLVTEKFMQKISNK